MTVAAWQVELQNVQSTASLQAKCVYTWVSSQDMASMPGSLVLHLTPDALDTAEASGRRAGRCSSTVSRRMNMTEPVYWYPVLALDPD